MLCIDETCFLKRGKFCVLTGKKQSVKTARMSKFDKFGWLCVQPFPVGTKEWTGNTKPQNPQGSLKKKKKKRQLMEAELNVFSIRCFPHCRIHVVFPRISQQHLEWALPIAHLATAVKFRTFCLSCSQSPGCQSSQRLDLKVGSGTILHLPVFRNLWRHLICAE